MLNINIKVVNTITPDWPIDIHPLEQRSQNTITLGQLGERHYVALQDVHGNEDSQAESSTQRMEEEDEEDRIDFEQTSNLRGIPYETLLQEEQLGIPTWFLTLSAADMQWPEIIRSIALQYGTHLTDDDVKKMSWENKCKWLRSNPVTAARQFDHRLNLFFKEYIGGKGHPIGELQDYMIRIEFQARGSPHAHTILWMKNAPKLGVDDDAEVINFINEHQSCAVPDNSDEDMRDLVLSRQKHVHSKTCRRAGSCRFKFPHPPSMETIIARQPCEENPAAVAKELKMKEDLLRKVRTIMEDKNTPQDISLEHLLRRAKVDPQEYKQALKLTKSREQIILRRNPSETDINQYNPKILKLWRANMDIQFILDPYSCIMYITSYMLKSERAMSDLLQKVLEESRGEDLKSKLRKVGSAFLNNREVSAQEAVYRLLSLPLQRKSRQVVYVNTATKDKRVSMLKPRHVLESMGDDDDDIFCTSALDRYASRPRVLEEMSLAEFRATYNTGVRDPPDGGTDHIPDVLDGRDDNERNDKDRIQRHPPVIKLQNNLGNMKRRRQHCIIRFHKETKNDEERYRNLLMLYFPWRDEEVDLKAGFPSYKKHFEHVIDAVRANEAMFSINADAIDAAYNDLMRNGPPEDIWHSIAPNVEFEQAEQQAEGITVGGQMSEEDQRENIDLTPQSTSNHRSELHARFTAELNKVRMSSEEYRTMMRSLNSQQMEVLRFHRKWCKDTIIALKHDKPAPQYTIFLSGPGGVGKSHIIKLVHHETLRLLTPLSGRYFDPNDLPVLLTAFTGTAAFGINGMTLHSALSLGCGGKEYQPLSSDKLNTLRSRLGKLKLLIVDEVSMVGADILYHVHRRLQDICGNSDPDTRFGGVSILAVGDLFQLQPVGQRHVFSEPSSDYAKLHAKFNGSLWEENFRMIELTESMRQKEDHDFANLLMRVRKAACTESDINILKSRVISKTDPYPSEALHVFRNNKEADDHNLKHLTKLSSKVFHIKAIDTKDLRTGLTNVAISTKSRGNCALREVLSVAVGARVMVTVNVDVSDGIVNGAFATVVAIDSTGLDVQTILVKFDSDWVGQQAIANSQYKQTYPGVVPIQRQNIQISPNSGRRSVQVQRTQFPLSLAWACTIHKVQGKTLDKIVVSTEGKGPCFPGQAYVALSRVKSLNGLYLLTFEASAISVNLDVLKEMDRLQQELVPMAPQPSSTSTHNTCLNIKLLNIRSYLEHLQDLKADSSTLPVDVFCFVETFLYSNQQIEPFPPQAKAFRTDRVGRGGGVMTVAKQDLSPTQLRIPVSGLEYTATTITKASTTVTIINIYRSQSLQEEFFIDRIQRLLELLPSDILTVVLGDFNFDLLKCPPPKILAAMEQFGFIQHVKAPTTDNGTLLDHVYVRGHVEDNVHVTVIDTYYSDHDMVCVSLTDL
ncbi:PIF1 [Branchiostoma lanceolatum]|uniref:ATP-dependent DNA helicase n=1 Tax=Branchiostoma lanceolatum TaxID=7740 RepID=A0A8J9VV24_BRALA|nr:PIF1 [Branchiostoma lanceolatum]